MFKRKKMFNVIILGASGYTGAELVRIISNHEKFKIVGISAERKAGMSYQKVFPHLRHVSLPKLQSISKIDFRSANLVFCALPHATSQGVIKDLPNNLKISL